MRNGTDLRLSAAQCVSRLLETPVGGDGPGNGPLDPSVEADLLVRREMVEVRGFRVRERLHDLALVGLQPRGEGRQDERVGGNQESGGESEWASDDPHSHQGRHRDGNSQD